MTKTTHIIATFGKYRAVEERRHYLGRPAASTYHLEHEGAYVFHSNAPQPVVGVLAGLMLEGAK